MINFSNTERMLEHLAIQRPLFHSEADFQHALAWYYQQSEPNIVVRLELPIRSNDSNEYLDLHFRNENHVLAVELKYKTRRFSFQHNGEDFNLKQQGAQDIGRYDFLADVERLERFVAAKHATTGCAILLTNDSSYWSESSRTGTVDEMFRLTEGRVIHGSLTWHEHTSTGTMRNREKPIKLNGKYTVTWKPYSMPNQLPSSEFRYLAWHIT